MLQVFFIIWFALALAYAVLLLYYRHLWNQVPLYIPQHKTKKAVFISVIIAARNEEKNIGKLLQSIAAQTYDHDHFEVIVVNDHSEDRTAAIIDSFSGLKIHQLHLNNFILNKDLISYKKKAIETGIAHARGELIVTTDADCEVPSPWLETISTYYEEQSPKMIVMPVKIESQKSLLQKFQALDFMMLQGITAGAVQAGLHSMCNGANLAYTKQAFNAVKGFEGIDTVASGDDMLLMEKMKEKYPQSISYLLSPKVVVNTKPAEGLLSFLQQRIRWAGKTKAYRQKKILPVLLLVYANNIAMLIGLVVAISMDAIYGTSAIDEEDTGVSNNSDATITNPFHSLAAAGTYHQSLRLEESAVNERIAGDASALDDDAALFLEYQSLQSNDTAYDMNDAEISFEEWKRKRKQFKQGKLYLLLTTHSSNPLLPSQVRAAPLLRRSRCLRSENRSPERTWSSSLA